MIISLTNYSILHRRIILAIEDSLLRNWGYTISQFLLLVAAYSPLLLTLLLVSTGSLGLVTTVTMLGLRNKRLRSCFDFLIHKCFTVCVQLAILIDVSVLLLMRGVLHMFSGGYERLNLVGVILHFWLWLGMENMWVLLLQLLKHFWTVLRRC